MAVLARRPEHELDGPAAHLGRIGAHGRQLDAVVGGQRDVVEADHRRYPPAPAGPAAPAGRWWRSPACRCGPTTAVAPSSNVHRVRSRRASASSKPSTPALAGLFAQMVRHEGEAPVAEAMEMIDDRLHRRRIVLVDDAEPWILRHAERGDDHRNIAVEQQARQRRADRHAADDHPIDAPLDEGARRLPLGRRRTFGMRDQHGIAERAGGTFDADGELGIERIGEVGNDDAKRRAGSRLQRAGDGIGVVLGLGNRPLDAPRVSSATGTSPRMTLETVDFETPARRATSNNVVMRLPPMV